ncbi:hypothetical protein [methanotrophic endosymbiont of Bathymodiolus puteoserpentis (Logatchev)]|jgi:hypothetical protein|uniref:hypothetical protein n=1 Tax=methanotrophic endosymbiont of Bathymodiolus puteoserpentis (Logatchev) TaxID=343235 RepID=UPI00157B201B|nr:hypothetical protein [methanotrophic endosymbiont of Bathymodiolus puteoserpentis (Logatchev)]
MIEISWTEYFRYRVKLRGFNLSNVEEIIKYSTERYYDTATERLVIVGKDANILVMIPHEIHKKDIITPITIHATTRQQINYRVKSGRFENE